MLVSVCNVSFLVEAYNGGCRLIVAMGGLFFPPLLRSS